MCPSGYYVDAQKLHRSHFMQCILSKVQADIYDMSLLL